LTLHEEEILGKAYDGRLMKRLLRYLGPYWKMTTLAFLILIITTVADLAFPYIIKIAIDQEISRSNFAGLYHLAQLLLLILVVRSLSIYVYTLLTRWLGQKIMYDMRRDLFSHLQQLPLSFYDKNPVGRLVTRLTNDIETLNQMLSSGIVAVLGDLVVLVGIVFIMLRLNWQLALATFIVFPLIVLATVLFRSRVRKAYRQIRIRIARINSFLQENISGMATVQLFNREKTNYEQFVDLNDQHRQANEQSIVYHSIYYPSINLFTSISTGLILWFGGLRMWAGTLSIGILVAFIQYVRRFFEPIEDIADKYNIMQAAMASSERVFALFDESEQLSHREPQLILPPAGGKIEFRNVNFSYNNTDWVLKNISFIIQSGEKVALVGATGAGKTSIISLMNRMYEPSQGLILLDEQDISMISLADLRQRIGVVLQDVFIFSGSVKQNISLDDPNMSMEEIISAAKRVNAHGFIEKLPKGYDFVLAERGSNLS